MQSGSRGSQIPAGQPAAKPPASARAMARSPDTPRVPFEKGPPSTQQGTPLRGPPPKGKIKFMASTSTTIVKSRIAVKLGKLTAIGDSVVLGLGDSTGPNQGVLTLIGSGGTATS